MDNEQLGTSCRGCCFSIVENGKQTGCEVDMFPVFRETGSLVMDGDYFKTVKRYCPYYRPHSWTAGMGTDECIRKIQRERKLEIAAVVSCDGRTIDDVKLTVKSLNSQTMQLRQVIFVTTPRVGARPQDIVAFLRDLKPGFEWSVRAIADDSYTELDAIHDGSSDARGVYLLFCVAGFPVCDTTIEDLDYQVNWLNRRIAAVDPNCLHGTIVQSNVYVMVGGWAEVEWQNGERIASVVEKIRRIAKAQDSPIIVVDGALPHEA